MSFPRYPKYKRSGVKWLGEVPEHWVVKQFKRILQAREERSCDGSETLLSVSAYTGVTPRSELVSEGDSLTRADSLEGYKVCKRGDLVMNIMLAWNRGLAFTALDGIVSPAYCVFFTVADSDQTFLNYMVRSNEYILYFKAFSAGVIDSRLRLYPDTFGSLFCCIPPRHEQCHIASFLDHETAKIDALIAEQQRLIELLKEKRQAVISHAVTKGLNPDVPMKPSEIEWLGDVPADWCVQKMKWVAKMESGHTPDKKIAAYWENCEIPWVSLNDTGYLKDNDYISDTAYNVNELGIANSSARILPPRTVVFSRDATIGRCAITTRPMAVSQHFIAWICGELILPEYLLLRLRSMTHELERLTTGATLKTIGMSDVRTLMTPLPLLEEQKAIVAHVAALAAALDDLVTAAEDAVVLLQERRSALISAAVTGKIDVRGYAAAEGTEAV